MATWLTHLRAAERALELTNGLSRAEFYAGNIAPDCGVWTPEGFDPPPEVTHLSSPRKDDCDWRGFAAEYLPKARGQEQRSFILGYVSHLITDVAWSCRFCPAAKRRYPKLYESDPESFWRMVKRQWHGVDGVFLEQHPDFAPFAQMAAVQRRDCDILPFYTENNVLRGVRRIGRYYERLENRCADFTVITPDEVERFVAGTAELVAEALKTL